MDVTSTIAEKLEDLCACDFTDKFISESGFKCIANDAGTVVFLAKLHGTYHANSNNLISLLEQWIESGASINVQNIHMKVDPTCEVQIDSFVVHYCETVTEATAEDVSTWPVAIVSVIGSLTLLLVGAVIIISSVLLALKRRSTGEDSE